MLVDADAGPAAGGRRVGVVVAYPAAAAAAAWRMLLGNVVAHRTTVGRPRSMHSKQLAARCARTEKGRA